MRWTWCGAVTSQTHMRAELLRFQISTSTKLQIIRCNTTFFKRHKRRRVKWLNLLKSAVMNMTENAELKRTLQFFDQRMQQIFYYSWVNWHTYVERENEWIAALSFCIWFILEQFADNIYTSVQVLVNTLKSGLRLGILFAVSQLEVILWCRLDLW